MRYADALAYLDDHASYEKTGRITSPSLEPITRLTAAMGDPQHACPVIHVTGTNGKGSTVQMITRLLMAHGLTVGTYTSPHLERVNERLSRNGEPIDDDDFAEQVAAIADLEALIGVRPTYFETMTASAFRWFADIAVDVAVIEVGLLGRWDATNVVEAQVAVVTNIGMDHNEFAGPTLADIATEKAGIIKPTSAAVIGETRPELLDIFEARRRRRRCSLAGSTSRRSTTRSPSVDASSNCAPRPRSTPTSTSRCTASTRATTRPSRSPRSRRSSPARCRPRWSRRRSPTSWCRVVSR